MKYYLKTTLIGIYNLVSNRILLLLLLCGLTACDSETSPDTPAVCGDPTLRIHKVSFTLDGIPYQLEDLDALAGSLTVYQQTLTRTGITYEVLGIPDTGAIAFAKLEMIWPGTSGVSPWSNGSVDTSAFGCYIIIDSTEGSDMQLTPVSGNTHVAIFNKDSIYGTFCGTLKDQAGNNREITNGIFYYTNR